MKLKNIKIENYRFFKEEQEFDFTSKEHIPQNILLYGENGSGKTSLYNALKDFFFYYKNQTESKTKIKENKNIFAEHTDKPKIEITFENDVNIEFTESGFDKEELKSEIEQVSKSKLFLTYQDIYNLNNIFRKNVSYEDFKEIMIILFFDKLDKEFEDFEKSLILLEKSIFENKNKLSEDFEYIKKLIFGFKENSYKSDLNNIEKNEDSSIYDKVFYLSDTYISKFETMKTLLEKFLNICSNNKILDISTYEIIEKFDDIKENILKYTLENDRYETKEHSLGITIVDKEELEDIQVLDKFLEQIEESCSLANNYIECEVKANLINKFIYDEFNSKLDKINNILSFLEINIELKRVKNRPYIKFDLNFIFNKKIRNIDFDITLSSKELKNHWSNLNEAKLSALNLAIYFSSVLGKKPYIPILVLDDLLISLDMSNRDKILSLLLDRNISNGFFDDDYQMFIFTHDRAFFELAKYRFDSEASGRWKYFEMYEREKENKYFPFLTESLTYLEKAEKYFVLNEYEIAGNLLRKEAEKFCKEFLPKKYHYSEEYNLKELNGLINECINFAKNSDFESDLFEKFDKHRKFVLNPNSHDSYNVMKFKTEIKNCLDTFKELKKLRNQSFLNKGELLEFELTCTKGDLYEFEITLEDDFRLLQKDGNKVISKGLINFRIKRNGTYTKSESEHDNCTLKKFYSKNYDKSDKSKNPDFLEEILVKSKGIKLKDILV